MFRLQKRWPLVLWISVIGLIGMVESSNDPDWWTEYKRTKAIEDIWEWDDLLTRCFSPVLERYEEMDEADKSDVLRNIPIRTHCSDWNTAVDCFRQEFYTDVYDEALKIYDWFSNYVCVEHVDEIDRNFRCLMSCEHNSKVMGCFTDVIENIEGPCVAREIGDKLVQCAYGILKEKCGAESGSVMRDITTKVCEFVGLYADTREISDCSEILAGLKNALRSRRLKTADRSTYLRKPFSV